MIVVSRRNVIQDAVRRYSVFIDDERVGTLSAWRTGFFEVSPGHHVVRLRIDSGYSSSDDVLVDVAVGNVEHLRTWARVRRLPLSWKGIVTFLVNPNGYGLGVAEWDPFGLWGNPRPWIMLGRDRPVPGPRRFDDEPEAGSQESHSSPLVRFIDETTFALERHGYRIDDVDRFIGKVRVRIEAGEAPSAQDLAVTFETTYRGYEKAQVDVFMDSLRTNLAS
jgi:DivIVA domain-containing protein